MADADVRRWGRFATVLFLLAMGLVVVFSTSGRDPFLYAAAAALAGGVLSLHQARRHTRRGPG